MICLMAVAVESYPAVANNCAFNIDSANVAIAMLYVGMSVLISAQYFFSRECEQTIQSYSTVAEPVKI